MIKEQDILSFMRETAYKPMTYGELERNFDIEGADEFKQFLKMLNELEEAGHILRTRNDRYGVPERMDLLRGRLQAHAKGFGFLIPDDKDHPDVYINANDMNTAMNGDTILVRVTSRSASGGRMEGEVVRVVTRAITQIVGTFQHNESYGFVLPDDKRVNKDIFIPQEGFNGAAEGQKVVVRIVQYPEGRAAAQGEIIEILGHKNDPGVDILSIIRKYNLPESFSDEVMAEAAAVPDTISEQELVGRRDLRGKRIVTIDGEDAKDLDDAVNVERLPNGHYVLGVHIADVGYYVREGSALDREAYARGCSVYLVDRVIPMLPHRLSNGICSLNPQVDRLTMSCEMEFDENANVVRHDIFTSVIKTTERMTYMNVRKILKEPDEHPDLMERYAGLVDDFRLMEELAMKLRGKRERRGAIDFDFQEAKVIVDEDGKPVDIIKRERSIAEMIIEEFMLAANETVAEHFHWLKVPFLYRIHEDPDSEKLLHFVQFAANFGYTVRGGKGDSVHPRALQTLLEEIKGTKEETVISTVMLRSMKQAKYDAESLGHFGLAAEFYSHFTSPIRRYPDLVIHRVMREVLENGTLSDKRHEYLTGRMQDIAQQSSERERVAVDAERDTEALKKAEFMLDKIGEEFEGIISSVTNFGIFIELDNTVEGLIRLSDLTDDYYHYHDQYHVLIGERTSKQFRIGDEIKIRVVRVNMDEHTIDFEMVDMKPRAAGDRKPGFADKFGGRGGKSGGRGKGGRNGENGKNGKNGAVAQGGGVNRGNGQGESGGKSKKRKGNAPGGFGGKAGKRSGEEGRKRIGQEVIAAVGTNANNNGNNNGNGNGNAGQASENGARVGKNKRRRGRGNGGAEVLSTEQVDRALVVSGEAPAKGQARKRRPQDQDGAGGGKRAAKGRAPLDAAGGRPEAVSPRGDGGAGYAGDWASTVNVLGRGKHRQP